VKLAFVDFVFEEREAIQFDGSSIYGARGSCQRTQAADGPVMGLTNEHLSEYGFGE
jgi:hypothetical protein